MSYAERRRRKNSAAKTPAQIRQALAKSQDRHIHPQEEGYWHEYPGKFHREGCKWEPRNSTNADAHASNTETKYTQERPATVASADPS